ncbi:MAG TPA: hypothetical protein VL992_19830 [Tepidisphaeraceae bacterium]|nr:hypothetical protein [Tepidisphaeraceae bacterium]
MSIDKKIVGIFGLMLLAAVLCWLNFAARPARADLVLNTNGYQVMTAASANGGDNLYIYDNSSGIMAVFVYDPSIRGMRTRAFMRVAQLFGGR